MMRMWLAAAMVGVWAVVAAAQAPAQEKDAKKQKEDDRPEINLKVSPLIAFSPAKISVRAELKGGPVDYEPFYCPTIVWDWDDGTTSENTPDCAPYEPGQSEIRRYYSSTHVYQMAGRFNVRFRMKKGDRTVGGNATVVQVRPGIRDPSEPPQ
jgi:hypothetical protein